MLCALVGAGNMGMKHTNVLLGLDVTIESVCDISEVSLEAYKQRFKGRLEQVKYYQDFDQMLASSQADMVIITLPPFAQDGQFEKAAEAKKHVFIEKPIALTPERGLSMVRAAQNNGIISSVGFHMRQGAVYRYIKQLMKEGKAGKPVLFQALYSCNSLHTPWWRDKEKSGGQILEQVIHLYDLGRSLLGEPQGVSARMQNICHNNIENYTVEDVSSSLTAYASGAIGTISATNCAVPGVWKGAYTLVFENLMVECQDSNHATFIYTNENPIRRETISEEDSDHAKGIEEFVNCVKQDVQSPCSIEEGYKSLLYVYAATQSAEQSGNLYYLKEEHANV
ncbi:MAG: iolX 1 [Spirochaeta sp.]|jgi:predicted dehydrogenase|nr:iolX 1 [Spirochaeta sp.]